MEYHSQNGIGCTVIAPDTFPTNLDMGDFRRNIFLSVKEALHNIVKHSQAAHVTMTIIITKNLQVIIKDNGTGFNKNNIRRSSNGLNNMQKRMSDLNGELKTETINGTTVTLTAPLPA